MDAIVTIQILDGKKAVYSTETAVEIHPAIAAEITTYPDTAACWILGQARENVHNDGAAFVASKSKPETVVEPEKIDGEPVAAVQSSGKKSTSKKAGE